MSFLFALLLHCVLLQYTVLHAQPVAVLAEAVAAAALAAPLKQPPYHLTMCVMVHNEGKYLLEWRVSCVARSRREELFTPSCRVLYHYLIGFQHFFIYDNDSKDKTRVVLRPLIRRGLVTILPWPGGARQGEQLNHCFVDGRHLTTWMANVDVDEYVVVLSQLARNLPWVNASKPFALHAFLARATAYGGLNGTVGAIVLDRISFGPSGHKSAPKQLVMRAYTEREQPSMSPRPVGKVIVQLGALAWMLSAHDAQMKPGFVKTTADLEEYSDATQRSRLDGVRINHYVTRSHGECIAKLTLGRWPDNMDWRKTNGKALCDRRLEGTPEWEDLDNSMDVTLAASPLPDIVREMMVLLRAQP